MWIAGKDERLPSNTVISTTVHCLRQSHKRVSFLGICYSGSARTLGPSNRILSLIEARSLIPGEVMKTSHGPLGTTHMG